MLGRKQRHVVQTRALEALGWFWRTSATRTGTGLSAQRRGSTAVRLTWTKSSSSSGPFLFRSQRCTHVVGQAGCPQSPDCYKACSMETAPGLRCTLMAPCGSTRVPQNIRKKSNRFSSACTQGLRIASGLAQGCRRQQCQLDRCHKRLRLGEEMSVPRNSPKGGH